MKLLTLIIAILFACPVSLQAFTIPETLRYRLMYADIKVGESSLNIDKEGDNIVIKSEANSSGVISILYNVKDRVKSTLKIGGDGAFIPLIYRINLYEGGYKRDKEVIFETNLNRVLYQDFLDKTKEYIELPPNLVDPLISIYVLRNRELVVGRSEFVRIFDSKKEWNVEVLVLRKETVKTPAGVFDTIVIRPLMESEGIFKRTGPMDIYITDDAKKIPVRLLTKVTLGTVIAELIEIK